MRRLLVAASVVLLVTAGAGAAIAGEVKGPSRPDNDSSTAAPSHANSACAFSGLNDLDSQEGQLANRTQTAADSWKFYGLPKGSPGTLGLCRGGTN